MKSQGLNAFSAVSARAKCEARKRRIRVCGKGPLAVFIRLPSYVPASVFLLLLGAGDIQVAVVYCCLQRFECPSSRINGIGNVAIGVRR